MNIWTQTLIEDISVVKLTQPAVAQVIAMVIINGDMNMVDWKTVNDTIKTRWSLSARERVLTMAWKIVEQAKAAALAEGAK